MSQTPKRWVIGVTGASGIQYAITLVDKLSASNDVEVHVVFSDGAIRVLAEEMDLKATSGTLSTSLLFNQERSNVIFHSSKNIGASIASGSFICEGMVIVPCSMFTLGMIANGCGTHLVHRAADVMIKEKRPLILVPRETPVSQIHLENMLKLAKVGAQILPASPGFYQKPQSVEDVINSLVMKILDAMQVENTLLPRWGEAKKLANSN